MSNILKQQNIKKDILAGLTGAMLLGSYALCAAASAGLGLWNVLFCIVVCSLLSVKLKNKIYAPDAFLLIPVHYIISECGINLNSCSCCNCHSYKSVFRNRCKRQYCYRNAQKLSLFRLPPSFPRSSLRNNYSFRNDNLPL